jgi:HSP20 family protein
MAMRDLVPWSRGRDVSVRRGEDSPFLALHREMNRLFDDVFHGFGVTPFGSDRFFDRIGGRWPSLELSQSDTEIKITAELPGLDEKDVTVELANGVLAIAGEKKTETKDEDRLFSERYYGRFERRIPVEDVDEDKVSASFKNGVLTVTLPRTAGAQRNARRIAINSK